MSKNWEENKGIYDATQNDLEDAYNEAEEVEVVGNDDDEDDSVVSKKRSMSYFMKGRAKEVKDIEPDEVIVSKRYVDEDGKIIPFLMKPITSKRIEQIQDECTKPVKRKGKVVDEKIDYGRFGARIAIESTVYPNFRDKQLLRDYDLVDPVELAKKILEVGGEYTEWITAAQRINGFDEDFEELVKDAKN